MYPKAKLPVAAKALGLALFAGLLLVSACTVKKDESGGNKNVKVNTPVGDVRVTTEADVKDVGLALYPGSTPKPKTNDDSSTANVNISTGLFGLKVVALKYTTEDTPDKVAAFYKKELGKYGEVIECPGRKATVSLSFSTANDNDGKLSCDKEHPSADTVEFKAGRKDSQHIVSIKPSGKGSEFTLVYVSTRGKSDGAL